MVIGKYQKKINLFVIFGILFSVQCQTLKPTREVNIKNFFSVDSNSISVIIDQWPLNIENIELSENSVFFIKNIKKYGKNQCELIMQKLDDSLTPKFFRVRYIDSLKQPQNINVFFYSIVINLDRLNYGQKFEYNREKDLAPPIITMSSLQVGDFVVCDGNNIKYRFESTVEFYLLFSSIQKGTYEISESNCSNHLFEIIVN